MGVGECGAEISQRSCIFCCPVSISHHFVEARRVLQAVSDFYQRPFLVVLLRPDVVQLDCQLLDVGSEVFYCLQPVCEVTERGGLVRKASGGRTNKNGENNDRLTPGRQLNSNGHTMRWF